MNTQGWVRGLISHNSELDKFANFVANNIAKEFELKLDIVIEEQVIDFTFGDYEVTINKEELRSLQKRSPYALDKYIINEMKDQGLAFDVNRSQYIQYCYMGEL